jgi:hypothetical protein
MCWCHLQVFRLKFGQLGWANRNMDKTHCTSSAPKHQCERSTPFSITSMTEPEPSPQLSSLLPVPSYMQPTRSTSSKGSSRGDLHPSSTRLASSHTQPTCSPSSKGSHGPTSQSNRQGIVHRISSTGRDETERAKTRQVKSRQDKKR